MVSGDQSPHQTTKPAPSGEDGCACKCPEALGISVNEAYARLKQGTMLRRVKLGIVRSPAAVALSSDDQFIQYRGKASCLPNRVKSVNVAELVEIREGWASDGFNFATRKKSFCEEFSESQCFTVVLRHPVVFQKSINFIAADTGERKLWVASLRHMIHSRLKGLHTLNQKRWLQENFKKADKNGNGLLSFSEVWALLEELQVEVDESYAKKLFKRADNEESTASPLGALDSEEFVEFFKLLTRREEIENLMTWYSSTNDTSMTAEDIQDFMIKEQDRRDFTIEDGEKIIQAFEPSEENRKLKLLSESGFRKLLLSKYGSIINEKHLSVCQDMTLPLPNYLVNSSHNTYLVGDQLRGDASVEGYVNALMRGARLVELDCWDGPNNEPILTHGHTLVKPILLVDALTAIAKYAFKVSPYPVVLSVENHCSLEQQNVMAQRFESALGSYLYRRHFSSSDANFPSPEDLKHKILIKGKKLPPELMAEGITDSEESENDSDDEDKAKQQPEAKQQRKKLPFSHALSEVIAIKAVKVRDPVADIRKLTQPDSFASWGENKMIKELGKNLKATVELTSRFMLKSYPKGLRTDSSNMEPIPQWLAGIQFVTMNMQTPGLEMDLYEGFFSQNGRCGYVLKPGFLRRAEPFDDIVIEKQPPKMALHVRVISAQYLPRPDSTSDDVCDPFVEIQIHGLPIDRQMEKTEVVRNNGFNPVWDDTFNFNLRAPKFALIRFCVKDYDKTSYNDFIAQYTVPVDALSTGYRIVPLLTTRHQGYSHIHLCSGYHHKHDPSATLFVQIRVKHLEE